MIKKITVLSLLVLSGLILSGCTINKSTDGLADNLSQKTIVKEEAVPENTGTNNCKEENVPLPNYGDPGKRLKNCFVEYPGEPTRQDKSYYIIEDICGQFTKEFVQNALGKPILGVEPSKISSLYNCSYFLNDKKDYVMLVLEYLSIENQKKGHESMGRTLKSDSRIPMENYLTWQGDGLLNTIYLVLEPEKFISIERSSGSGLTAEELTLFASNIGKAIKNYK